MKRQDVHMKTDEPRKFSRVMTEGDHGCGTIPITDWVLWVRLSRRVYHNSQLWSLFSRCRIWSSERVTCGKAEWDAASFPPGPILIQNTPATTEPTLLSHLLMLNNRMQKQNRRVCISKSRQFKVWCLAQTIPTAPKHNREDSAKLLFKNCFLCPGKTRVASIYNFQKCVKISH